MVLCWNLLLIQLKAALMAIYFGADHLVWAYQIGLTTDKAASERCAISKTRWGSRGPPHLSHKLPPVHVLRDCGVVSLNAGICDTFWLKLFWRQSPRYSCQTLLSCSCLCMCHSLSTPEPMTPGKSTTSGSQSPRVKASADVQQ